MKNIFKTLAAVALIAMTASCSKDGAIAPAVDGEEVNATFSVQLPGGIVGRATNDGTMAKYLNYAVYEAGNANERGVLLGQLTTENVEIQGGAWSVSIPLVADQSYDIVFWAQAPGAPYTFDWANKQVNMNYTNGEDGSNEKRDAFFAVVDNLEIKGATQKNVTLKRPFAQLNIGLTEGQIEAAQDAGFELKYVTVSAKANSTFNFSQNEGKAEGKTAVEFAAAEYTLPVRVVGGVEDHKIVVNEDTYDWVSFNYLLTDAALIDVDVTFTNENDTKAIELPKFTNVPIERNHRTNIVGDLLTDPANFNVTINPNFDEPTIDHEVILNIETLQEAIDNAPVGTTTLNIAGDFVGDVTVFQQPGKHIIIDGNGVSRADEGTTFNGTFKIHNGSSSNDGSIIIEGINFKTATPSLNFIMPNDFGVIDGVACRYSQNVTVKDCTFTATGEAENTAVGVQAKSSKNLQVINCTATNMHSLIQAQSCDESVVVKNCTVKGKNGVAFKQVKAAVVEGGTINAAEYGIRYDGNIDNYGITINGVNVEAKQPVIVRKMTGANNTIAFEGTNTLEPTTEGDYNVVITNGSDDAEYVKPTGTYTLTGAENFVVYPRDYELPVATWEEFTAALAAGEQKVKFTADMTYEGNYSLKANVSVNLNGKSLTMPMFYVFSTATIKNGTINGKMYARKGCKATLDGLTFSGTISDDLSTEGHLQVQGGCDVYAKNCTFAATTVNGSQTRSLSIEGSSSGTRKFENCDFKFLSWGTGPGKYKKNVYINTMSGTTTVDFTNCKLNGKAPNIIFASTYSLTNLTMNGCDNTAPTLETNRAKDAITEAEWAHISALIANNKFTQVRLFYAGGSSEYIKK